MSCILFLSLPFGIASAQVRPDTAKIDTARSLTVLPDSVKPLKSKFRAFIVPAAFISYGALSFALPPIRQVDHSIHNEMTQHYPNFRSTIDNYLQFAPTVGVYALNFAGVQGKNTFIDRTILLVMSEAIFYAATAGLKAATGRLRPDGSNRYSWPSGHAGNAFTSAEFMAQEFSGRSPWYGVMAYSFATTTAVMRIYNDKHWFSDIIAGAGFGIIATKTAYYIYPAIRKKLFRAKEGKNKALLLPSFRYGTPGILFTATF
ncbi:phosphatase PAP2 family protein [Mucilaginibacter defluvii]|uniref:Phosphatase PAP2 family protein n=2 Tax=Mucilaginibacter defluvii TaxID=1196019 RepID=A0ABP9FPZ3_9SPHI